MTNENVSIKHNDKQNRKYQPGSGSKYHQEHASHVPDYGANSVDPNVYLNENSDNNH